MKTRNYAQNLRMWLLYYGMMPKVLVAISGAIFDTQVRDVASFKPVIEIAAQQDVRLEYFALDKILDSRPEDLADSVKDVAFFCIDVPLLRAWTSKPNVAVEHFLQVFHAVCQQPNVTVVLCLPPLGKQAAQQQAMVKMLTKLSAFSWQDMDDATKIALDGFLANPLENRKMACHTTLMLPMCKPTKSCKNLLPSTTCYLPNALAKSVSSELNDFLPLAMRVQKSDRNLIFSSSVLFSLLGPCEPFQILPVERYLQDELVVLLAQFFSNLKDIVLQNSTFASVDVAKVPTVFSLFSQIGFTAKKKICTRKPKTQFNKVAWIELERESKSFAMQVEQLLAANIDWMWINLSPNTFLVNNGIHREQATNICERLEKFCAVLQKRAKELGKPLPKLLLGFELGNNIVGQNSPKEFARDVFGNNYDDMPAPLDSNFWLNEYLSPLRAFLQYWKQQAIGKAVPVDGVVLDIEFYNRKWTSMFLATMGFEDVTKNLFAQKTNNKQAARLAMPDFIKYLQRTHQMQHYFKFLRQQAHALGEKLRMHTSKVLPDKPLCIYLPNLNFDWFCSGFFSGLSDKKPIHIFSFNSSADLVVGLLHSKKIHASHSAPFMLSKINDQEDFGLVLSLFNQNRAASTPEFSGGLWFNRFSRLDKEYQPGQWFFLEQTSAGKQKREQFCQFLEKVLVE